MSILPLTVTGFDITNDFQCFGVLTSILSHLCVRAGLGRHQNTLDPERVVLYFKVCNQADINGLH